MSNHHAQQQVRCPRCGYDQRGVIAQWRDACDLMGRCAECGLDFRWAELLVPEKFEPLWCVEFAPRRARAVLTACLRTTLRAIWPWALWTRMNVAHDVRWRRLMLYACFLAFVGFLFYATRQTVLAVTVHYQLKTEATAQIQETIGRVRITIPFLRKELERMKDANADVPEGANVERDEYIRRRRQVLNQFQATLNNPPSFDHSYVDIVVDAVSRPISATSPGPLYRGSWRAYPAPSELGDAFIEQSDTAGSFQPRGFESGTARFGWAVGFGFALLVLLLFPAQFVLLPLSRRTARVRWRHVGRAFVYSLTIPIIALCLAAALACLALTHGILHDAALQASVYVALGSGLYLMFWWSMTIGRYMRMQRVWLIAVVFAFNCILTTALVVYWLHTANVVEVW